MPADLYHAPLSRFWGPMSLTLTHGCEVREPREMNRCGRRTMLDIAEDGRFVLLLTHSPGQCGSSYDRSDRCIRELPKGICSLPVSNRRTRKESKSRNWNKIGRRRHSMLGSGVSSGPRYSCPFDHSKDAMRI
jgi:hypothetical protein